MFLKSDICTSSYALFAGSCIQLAYMTLYAATLRDPYRVIHKDDTPRENELIKILKLKSQ